MTGRQRGNCANRRCNYLYWPSGTGIKGDGGPAAVRDLPGSITRDPGLSWRPAPLPLPLPLPCPRPSPRQTPSPPRPPQTSKDRADHQLPSRRIPRLRPLESDSTTPPSPLPSPRPPPPAPRRPDDCRPGVQFHAAHSPPGSMSVCIRCLLVGSCLPGSLYRLNATPWQLFAFLFWYMARWVGMGREWPLTPKIDMT